MNVTPVALALGLLACAPVEEPMPPAPTEPSQTNAGTEESAAEAAQMSREEAMAMLLGCDAQPLKPYVGEPLDSMSDAQWLELAGAKELRKIRPGQPMSKDYRTARLTLMLDSDDTVVSASCG